MTAISATLRLCEFHRFLEKVFLVSAVYFDFRLVLMYIFEVPVIVEVDLRPCELAWRTCACSLSC